MILKSGDTYIDVGSIRYTADSASELYNKIVYSLSMNEFMQAFNIHLMNPKVIVGIFVGSMLVFFFCVLTMKAVGEWLAE